MNAFRRCLLIALFLPAAAYGEVGTSGAVTLRRLDGARPTALGRSFVGVEGDLNGANLNPAGVASLPHPALLATYLRGLADDSLGSALYGHPIPGGAVFGGAAFFDAGTVDINLSDGTRESRRAQQDVIGMAGVALRRGPVAVGVNGKYYRFELGEEADASGAAFDVGLQLRTPVRHFVLGASVQNLGSDVTFERSGDPLPRTVRAGAAYTLHFSRFDRFADSPYAILLLGEAVEPRDDEIGGRGGVEIGRTFTVADAGGWAALRGGYLSEPAGATAGVGVRLEGFTLDYGVQFVNDLSETHRVTAGFLFGTAVDEESFRLPSPASRQR